MKTFVLSTLISVAALGNSFAGTPDDPIADENKVTTLKEATTSYRHNVEVLYNQYDLAEERIKMSPGNHQELDRDHQFFVSVYQQDIDKGIRVTQSRKAIDEINARYAKLHADRNAYEMKKIAKLKKQLEVALQRENRDFNRTKKALTKSVRKTR